MSSEVSREKPIDYALMARILIDERERGGYPIWVTRSGARALARAQRHGLVHPQRLRRRAARRQRRRRARHRGVDLRHDARHERARARRRRAGTGCTCAPSTRCARRARSPLRCEQGIITDGIMHACVTTNMPFVLTGSIRDDGPLPDVDHRRARGAGRDARARHQGDDGDPHRHRAARDRHRQHAARVRHASRTARCASWRRSASTRRSSS